MEFLDKLGDEARNRVEAISISWGLNQEWRLGLRLTSIFADLSGKSALRPAREQYGLSSVLMGRLPCFFMASRRSVRSSTLTTWSWPKPGLSITCGGKGHEAKQKRALWEIAPFC